MTNFIIIDPIAKSIHNFAANNLNDAILAAGLDRHETDHGRFSAFMHIVCYEYGLLSPKTDKYFCASKQLYNGPSVLYGVDPLTGDTISIPIEVCNNIKNHPSFAWLDGINAVEAAIAKGKVNRPQTVINDEVVWRWNIDKDKDHKRISDEVRNRIDPTIRTIIVT